MHFSASTLVLALFTTTTTLVAARPVPLLRTVENKVQLVHVTNNPKQHGCDLKSLDLIMLGQLPKSACCSYGRCIDHVNVISAPMPQVELM